MQLVLLGEKGTLLETRPTLLNFKTLMVALLLLEVVKVISLVKIPIPIIPVWIPIEQQTDLSPRPSPTPIIPDSVPETSGENL
ncbi:hypothetical protein Tco_0263125, partial [Tanacetum coccineum]